MRVIPVVVALFVLPATAFGQQYRYDWNGPSFTSASGTVPITANVSGFLVLDGPIENLLFQTVTPVRFSFTSGPVTIDDATPLHPLTVIKLRTNASGEIIQTEIQLVEEIDTGSGTAFADVICVAQCPAAGPNDFVIDRNALAQLIGTGEAAVVASFWSVPTRVAPSIPALPWPGLSLGIPLLAAAWLRRRRTRSSAD